MVLMVVDVIVLRNDFENMGQITSGFSTFSFFLFYRRYTKCLLKININYF